MLQELIKNYPGVDDYHLVGEKSCAIVKFDTSNDAKIALSGKNTCIVIRLGV